MAISVLSAGAIADQGMTRLQDLYEATPGLTYDEPFGDRNASQPGIRGVQSDEIVSTQQKVNTFIDGLPMIGPAGSLGFFGVEQVEVYRGPQSAAFGRSTFAGAINYVTADASEEFEGSIQVRTSSLETNELGLSISGPITDSVGYRLGYFKESFTGPDEWVATDGVRTGDQDSSTLTAKLNFEFSDTAYGELMFTRLEQDDGAAANYILDPAACAGDADVWFNSMGSITRLFTGDWDCDMNSDVVRRNHDVLSDFIADYDPAVFGMDIDSYLDQTFSDGTTFRQQLQIASVVPSVVVDRDRWQGELNFEIGDSLLTFLGMYIDEYYNRWAPHTNDTRAVFVTSMGSPALDGNQGGRTVRGSPTNTEEEYLEVRWASPESERLRYTLSGSYYAFDFGLKSYNDWGAIYYGLINESTGDPVDPQLGNLLSKVSENLGASFGLQYDLTDDTTLSFEGRYQTDEICGTDFQTDITACETTNSFAPRLAINTSVNEDLNVYAQVSQGTNPAGINVSYSNPEFVEALNIASGSIPVPAVAFDGSLPGNAGVVYDGSSATTPVGAGYTADSWLAHKEEVLTNFEIGAKGSFLDGRGSFTSALYYMIWEDLLSVTTLNWGDDSSIADGDAYNGWNYEDIWADAWRTTLNAGDATLYGLELAASYNINDIWTIGGNLTLSSSTYDDYCSVDGPNYFNAASGGSRTFQSEILTVDDGELASCVPAKGNTLPNRPTVKGAFDISAHLPNEIFGMHPSLRADVRHTGSRYEDVFNLSSRKPVTTMNLSASLRGDDLAIRLFVNNLTDVDEPTALGYSDWMRDGATLNAVAIEVPSWSVTPRRPREVGVSISYDF